MKSKKLVRKLHLWLGLVSGIIVCIVAITGCIYAFEPEIRAVIEPEQFVEMQDKPFLSPTQLRERAMPYIYKSDADSSNTIYGVTYRTANKSVSLAYDNHNDGYSILMLNPYDGTYSKDKVLKNDFFRIILAGHRNLWLPYQIGHQIVGWAIIIFVILILTGFILWLPKKINKKTFKNSLTIKWKTTWRRRIYDLHRILGIYSIVFALVLALTGLTWSFSWYGDTYFKIISGGEKLSRWKVATSDTALINRSEDLSEKLWDNMKKEYPIGLEGSFSFDFPTRKEDAYRISFNPQEKTYYKSINRFFDQYNLTEVEGGGIYGIAPEKQSYAEKFYRMTYDIHIGSIGGLFGRILVFAASLIIGTLPLTGFFIFIRKKSKRK